MNITLLIVASATTISLFCFSNRRLFDQLKHHPYIEQHKGQFYRWLTSGFVHGDFIHLFVNMFVLYEFGRTVEDYFAFHYGENGGRLLFLFMYLLIIIMANIPTYFRHHNHYHFASVGASGGVSGIIFIFILLHPWTMLGLFAIIPIPAILFGILYLWYSTWASKKQNDMIDHEAHFYGAIAGLLVAIVSRPAILGEFIENLIHEFPL
jgi:membrane associated rhomboid family serine protease